mgnify:FL=1
MEQIENHMVMDSLWESYYPEQAEKLRESGYHKCGTEEFVPENEAYEYALDQCLNGSEEDQKEFKAMLVEWYFSGGAWRKEEGYGN